MDDFHTNTMISKFVAQQRTFQKLLKRCFSAGLVLSYGKILQPIHQTRAVTYAAHRPDLAVGELMKKCRKERMLLSGSRAPHINNVLVTITQRAPLQSDNASQSLSSG